MAATPAPPTVGDNLSALKFEYEQSLVSVFELDGGRVCVGARRERADPDALERLHAPASGRRRAPIIERRRTCRAGSRAAPRPDSDPRSCEPFTTKGRADGDSEHRALGDSERHAFAVSCALRDAAVRRAVCSATARAPALGQQVPRARRGGTAPFEVAPDAHGDDAEHGVRHRRRARTRLVEDSPAERAEGHVPDTRRGSAVDDRARAERPPTGRATELRQHGGRRLGGGDGQAVDAARRRVPD